MKIADAADAYPFTMAEIESQLAAYRATNSAPQVIPLEAEIITVAGAKWLRIYTLTDCVPEGSRESAAPLIFQTALGDAPGDTPH
jgi:hypothetical protein